MTKKVGQVAALASEILSRRKVDRRCVVAVSGAPASGKTTLAEKLARQLTDLGHAAQVVPMDGFHLDNRLLDQRGLRARKGAPETFDLRGFAGLVAALSVEPEVVYPLFDRGLDMAIAGAGCIHSECKIAVVEGNYLLLDEPGWSNLTRNWDISIHLKVSEPELRKRLVTRWLNHGLNQQEAETRAEQNDLKNARRIAAALKPYDIEFELETP